MDCGEEERSILIDDPCRPPPSRRAIPAVPAETLHGLAGKVRKPGQYLGLEWNPSPARTAGAALRVALGFPDAYEIGMSCLGFLLVHGLINSTPGAAAERFFCPMPDMEAAMRGAGVPLFTAESGSLVRGFDVVAFSLQYEILFTNVLNALDLAGIPIRSSDRGEGDPMVIAGGPASMAPEPMAPFIDAFLPGDAEDTLPGFLEAVSRAIESGASRAEKLETFAKLRGVYVPSLYGPTPDGRVLPLREGLPGRITTGICGDLENSFFPVSPPVPAVETAHERIVLEIMRGCPNFCRFCQAGFTRRPPRTRSKEKILELARLAYRNTGYQSISLASLSSSDYPGIAGLLADLVAEFSPKAVGVSMPSLRVDEGLLSLPAGLSDVRKSGLTLAPEAACAGLRRSVNKHVRDEDLDDIAMLAWESGWRVLKLYFMIGLPGETADDRAAVVDLAHRISGLRRRSGKGPGQVNVTISNFVPRPHTPMQWCAMETGANLDGFQRELRRRVRMKSVRLKMHDPRRNLIETLLARGDRSVAAVVEGAWRLGARFDAWDELFKPDLYDRAIAEAGVDPARFTGSKARDEAFPWEIIDPGVSRDFLLAEYGKSLSAELTGPCKAGSCAGCGADPSKCMFVR